MQSPTTKLSWHVRWSLLLLCMISTLNFVDRQILTILIEPIKKELQLADWHIGALMGAAFVVCYSLLSLPAARLADRVNRPRFLGAAVAVWSIFTAVCGYAGGFFTLAAARAGVSVGESAAYPAGQSLAADLVPPERRASALAIFNIGVPLGAMFGMAIGGIVAQHYGWRAAFMVVGIPGLIVALLAWFTLPEPREKLAAKAEAVAALPWRAALKTILVKRSFIWLSISIMMFGAVNLGLFQFVAAFFSRSHGPELAEVAERVRLATGINLGPMGFLGTALGLSAGITGMIGGLVGGRITDHFVKRDVRANLFVPLCAMTVSIPIYLTMLFTPGVVTALCILSMHTLVMGFMLGPLTSSIMGIAPREARATASSLYLIAGNLFGAGLGPVFIGLISDTFNQSGMGPAEGLRASLMATKISGVICIFTLYMASRSYKKDWVG